MNLYTTKEAAKAIGVTRVTLQRWVSWGKVKAPELKSVHGGGRVRFWTQRDVAKIRKQLSRILYKSKNGRKRRRRRVKRK